MHYIDIFGMPYFPGVAEGKLHRGKDGDGQCIVLITQDEISTLTVLPAGIVVVEAAPFSHTMIGLLGLGVPTVLISEGQAAKLKEGVPLLIDGNNGRITDQLDLVPQDVEYKSSTPAGQAVLMADGESVNLRASVRQPTAARQAVEKGAESIGLVRSEFLVPADDAVPDTTFYQDAFRELCQAASPLTVTYRLLDLAADKIPLWLPQKKALGQVLGVQGVRMFKLAPVDAVIDAQLGALSELANEFNLRVLIPYIVRLEEYAYWLSMIRKRLPDYVPVGTMAETPASVLDIRNLLDCADFVAIGCNDLMQALYAADRDKPELRHYLDPYAPLLYRLFRQIAEQAGNELRNVQLCGVLAQIQGVLPVLVGLGYRTFSVDPPFIPYLANSLAKTTKAKCEKLASNLCVAKTTQEALEILQLPTDRHPPF